MEIQLKKCPYGEKCYRKNPEHLKEFHPQRETEPKKRDESSPSTKKRRINDYFTHLGSKKQIKNEPQPLKTFENVEQNEPERENVNKSPVEIVSHQMDLTLSKNEIKNALFSTFEMEYPEDLFIFWDLCRQLNPEAPLNALKPVGIRLIGPFEVCAGLLSGMEKSRVQTHWRFRFDSPEFQTFFVVEGDESHRHFGYFRDSPFDLPAFVGENKGADGPKVRTMGETAFSAVRHYIDGGGFDLGDPEVKRVSEGLDRIARENGISTELISAGIRRRARNTVCKTLSGQGIVVKVVNDVGYRPLPLTEKELVKIVKRIDEEGDVSIKKKIFGRIEEVITLVQFANDECDYGEGLELGLQLFFTGSSYCHNVIGMLLETAYSLLERDLFGEIMLAHLKVRDLEMTPKNLDKKIYK